MSSCLTSIRLMLMRRFNPYKKYRWRYVLHVGSQHYYYPWKQFPAEALLAINMDDIPFFKPYTLELQKRKIKINRYGKPY